MAAILCLAIMVGVVLFLVVYSFIHKPQVGDIAIGYRTSHVIAPSRVPTPDVSRPPAPPPKQWHDQLSNDQVEHRLLATLRAAPSDEVTRMVYADWLEQRGDLAKADFVRGNELAAAAVLVSSDVDWRVITCRASADCTTWDCPQSWDRFEPTDDERVRKCGTCRRSIRYCATRLESPAVVRDLAITTPLEIWRSEQRASEKKTEKKTEKQNASRLTAQNTSASPRVFGPKP